MVERVTSNDEVAGSIPSEGIYVTLRLLGSFFGVVVEDCRFFFCAGLFCRRGGVFLPSSLLRVAFVRAFV
jgi:hypothetical protein